MTFKQWLQDLIDNKSERELSGILTDAWDFYISEQDPTPWCHGCGAMTRDTCPCGPMAENN